MNTENVSTLNLSNTLRKKTLPRVKVQKIHTALGRLPSNKTLIPLRTVKCPSLSCGKRSRRLESVRTTLSNRHFDGTKFHKKMTPRPGRKTLSYHDMVGCKGTFSGPLNVSHEIRNTLTPYGPKL